MPIRPYPLFRPIVFARFTLVAVLLIAAAHGLLPASASATGREAVLSPAFSPYARLGKGRSLWVGAFFTGQEYHAQVAPLSELNLRLLAAAAERPARRGDSAATSIVHIPSWMQKMEANCPIQLSINVFAAEGRHRDGSGGVTLQGEEIKGDTVSNTLPYPVVNYTWRKQRSDKICGAVGAWSGPKYVLLSLNPRLQTSVSGEYVDHSLDTPNGNHLSKFLLFAKRS